MTGLGGDEGTPSPEEFIALLTGLAGGGEGAPDPAEFLAILSDLPLGDQADVISTLTELGDPTAVSEAIMGIIADPTSIADLLGGLGGLFGGG